MADVQGFIQKAQAQGYSVKEISEFLNKKASSGEITQREADTATLNVMLDDLGVGGDLIEGSLAIPKFLFPNTTEEVQMGLYGTGAGLTEKLSGQGSGPAERRKEESSLAGVPGLRALPRTAPEISLALLLGPLLGKAGSKIGGPLAKIPFGRSSSMKASLSKLGAEKWDEVVQALNSPEGQAAVIKTKPIINKLSPLLDDAIKGQDYDTVKQIQTLIGWLDEAGDTISADKANALSRTLGKQVYGETGTGRLPEGVRKLGERIVGPELRKAATDQVDELSGLLKEYGDIANVSKSLGSSIRTGPATTASMFSGLGGYALGGFPGAAIASMLTAPTALALTNPMLRNTTRALLGRGIQYGGFPVLQAAGSRLIDQYNPF